jgi:hypothetical protein
MQSPSIERENIPDLTMELMNGTTGGLILLEQDSGGNTDRVAIHPIHLRYMAEKFGLIQTSDPTAQKTISMLERRLLLLRERIDSLADWLVNHSDHKHADLSYELTYAIATADIAAEYCAELADAVTLSNATCDVTSNPVAVTQGLAP